MVLRSRSSELLEAKQQLQMCRVLARWERYDLIPPMKSDTFPWPISAWSSCSRSSPSALKKTVVILTTNLPFSEWTQVIPNARLCKALLDRITDRAHIIETGADTYRFRRTVEEVTAKPTG